MSKTVYHRVLMTRYAPEGCSKAPEPSQYDLSRFKKNPIILLNHDWSADPVGLLIEIDDKDFSGVPTFHRQTRSSRMMADLIEEGAEMVYYPGGSYDHATGVFKVYEVSICPPI